MGSGAGSSFKVRRTQHTERRTVNRTVSDTWQARRVSNPQPPVLETGALPIELLAYLFPDADKGRGMRGEGRKCTTSSRVFSSLTPLPAPLLSEVLRQLLRLLVPRVLLAGPAVLAQLEALGRLLPVLRRAVVPALTVEARERNNVSHKALSRYARISVIVPAPTVRPPSRIAKREPFSMATGVINSPVMSVLSPGITISTPSGRWSEPVTSVVRM